ncbi:MAG: hypothetical protein GOU98_01735 [Candidatus Altiarchaeota archaeon]|nr:hypothetical protein [Candidatus Altiarchaeota archaeon]
MKAARFSESFAKKGFAKKRAIKLIEDQIKVKWHGALALGEFDPEMMPGVKEYGEAFLSTSKLEDLKKKTFECIKINEIKSFWLKVNRAGNHEYNSMDVARTVGKFVETKGHEAKSSGTIVSIDIQQNDAVIYVPKKGLGGLPMGTFGKVGFIWDGTYKSQVALLKMASRGYRPTVLAFGEGNPLLGNVIHIPFDDVEYDANHALRGMKGPILKAFMYKVAKELKVPFVGTGEVIGSSITDNPKLLYRIEEFSELRPVRPIGFLNMNDVRRDARKLGLNVEETQKNWKQFNVRELESEWISLEMDTHLQKAKKIIKNPAKSNKAGKREK